MGTKQFYGKSVLDPNQEEEPAQPDVPTPLPKPSLKNLASTPAQPESSPEKKPKSIMKSPKSSTQAAPPTLQATSEHPLRVMTAEEVLAMKAAKTVVSFDPSVKEPKKKQTKDVPVEEGAEEQEPKKMSLFKQRMLNK